MPRGKILGRKGRLVWDPANERYVRSRFFRTRNPFKGLIGHRGRKRSFADDMWPLGKPQPRRMSLTGAEKRRKHKGGSPTGGPGQEGAERFARDIPKSKRGLLA